MEESPGYYAIIPASVRYDQSLPANAKLLYGEISALAKKEGFCWARNSYFADLYHVRERQIGKWMAMLEKSGHIKREVDENGNSRKVFLRTGGPVQKDGGTPVQKDDHNNTGGINTNKRATAFEEIFKNWNNLPEAFPKAKRITDSRRRHMKARWDDKPWRESYFDALERLAESSFLAGESDRGWVADLDWFLKPDSVDKILEGKYDDRHAVPKRPLGQGADGNYR